MDFLESTKMAVKTLTVNKLRSTLTMLGIIIGVAAVITMIAVGQGATDRVQEQMKGLGSNIMLVLPGSITQGGARMGAQTGQALTEEDALAIALEVPEVQVAAPSMRSAAQVVAGNTNWSTSVFGTTNDYLEAREWPLESGRLFEAAEVAGSAKVVIIGQTAARELFGDADPLDQVIRVKKVPVTIIGVLSKKGQNSLGQDQDDVVMLPISTFRNRIQGGWGGKSKRVGSISVKVREGQSMKAAEDNIKDLLRQRFKVQPNADDPFSIRNLTEILQAQEASSRVMTLLLAAVAGISLIIGGIGIIGMEFATIFTNALMPTLTQADDLGAVSGTGFAFGYLGGLLALVLMLLFFAEGADNGLTLIGLEPLFGLDPEAREGTRFVGPFTAIWFAVFMIPFFLWVKEPKTDTRPLHFGRAWASLRDLLRSLRFRGSLSAYLASSLFYRDALNALYAFGGLYASGVLGWSIIQIGIFGIVGAVTAMVAAFLGGQADRAFGPKPVIAWSIVVLILVCLVIVGMTRESLWGLALDPASSLPDWIFFACGALIGAAGGTLQAASRTMMARHTTPDRATEAFGLFALSGKVASFMSPALIALATMATGWGSRP